MLGDVFAVFQVVIAGLYRVAMLAHEKMFFDGNWLRFAEESGTCHARTRQHFVDTQRRHSTHDILTVTPELPHASADAEDHCDERYGNNHHQDHGK
jgi:hypothetical protein